MNDRAWTKAYVAMAKAEADGDDRFYRLVAEIGGALLVLFLALLFPLAIYLAVNYP